MGHHGPRCARPTPGAPGRRPRAKIIRVDDRKSVPVQPIHHAPKARTMIAWMMWLSMRYDASNGGYPQMGITGAFVV